MSATTSDAQSNDPMSIPNPAQLVERWENVERVLTNLSEHDRKKHWDMASFIKDTPCGTVCCAAGHCAFDPWFKAQGFSAVPAGDEDPGYWYTPPGVDIHRFFGSDGSLSIFHDTKRRSVETVITEVREHIESLRQHAVGYGFAIFRREALSALQGSQS